ncbi:MAG: N-acetylneuraminate synthase family protein [Nitrospinota bacterium]
MNRQIRVGGRWVGEGAPCFIVAEAGSNHNGNLDQALRLIDVAAEAGADGVKFQNFKADRIYPRSAGRADYLSDPRSIHSIIEEMEMPEDWVPRLADYCRERGIEFISSPFDESSADLLEPHVNVFKIASYELTHLPLVGHVSRKGKPIFLSTGAADLAEARRTVDAIRSWGNDQIVVLQCTAAYPAPLDAINVGAMNALREATGLPAGLSDHSRDPIVAPVVAVALGACVVEKHFTLNNCLPGPDHRFAVEPQELAEMVRRIRQAERSLGHGRKEVLEEETELRAFARRSVFAIRDIAAGETFTPQNIAVLRKGKLTGGLEPRALPDLMGRRTARPLRVEQPVRAEDVVWSE